MLKTTTLKHYRHDLRTRLTSIQAAQTQCFDATGCYIRPAYRYRYNLLVREAAQIKLDLDQLDNIG